jgi:hypothetical protein
MWSAAMWLSQGARWVSWVMENDSPQFCSLLFDCFPFLTNSMGTIKHTDYAPWATYLMSVCITHSWTWASSCVHCIMPTSCASLLRHHDIGTICVYAYSSYAQSSYARASFPCTHQLSIIMCTIPWCTNHLYASILQSYLVGASFQKNKIT